MRFFLKLQFNLVSTSWYENTITKLFHFTIFELMSSKKPPTDPQDSVINVSGMYENWFLDYASYVILERAVPKLEDGLKPVQRRIFHAMKELDDGRFHKVANIIGHTMQYHPHGDASIGDALVNLGQKDLMVDIQGNWGDTRTGDRAAAPRYIEARLSKFALDVAFNNKITEWQLTYDGRKKEPVELPMKFPLLLFHGVEGIAVGLATKIAPHNFIELIEGSIKVLQGKKTKLLPDFPGGGQADCRDYNRGKKGGKIKVRADIEIIDKKTIAIRSIPYGTTTNSLIDSVVKANDKGKIKIKRIVDNTAKHVEILIEIPPGISPEITIDALYVFTDCEVSISPNACLIIDDKPHFLTVDEILRLSTENTKELLRKELEIKLSDFNEKWHLSSLEKIFIEKRIYRDIEECETWDAVISTIDKGLKKYVATPSDKKKKGEKRVILNRDITEEDIVKLTEIKIKRISKFDSFKADELIQKLEADIKETKHNLKNLTDYAIAYFQNLLQKHGKGRERKTKLTNFAEIKVKQVAVPNRKLYINAKDGFIGTSLKKDDFLTECSDVDDIIAFRKDGKLVVTKVGDKKFVGKNIIHAAVWKKGDERMTYNMIYADAKSKKNFAKRFNIKGVTRDKPYDLAGGNPGSKVVYFSANPNGESEVVNIQLSPNCRAHKKQFEFDFQDIAIKGKGSKGNIVSKWPIRKASRGELGQSTIGGVEIWYDPMVGRLNKNKRGDFLGEFNTGDFVLVLHKEGSYELTSFEVTNHYDYESIQSVQKLTEDTVVNVIYFHGSKKEHYVKRFKIETNTTGQRHLFVPDDKGTKVSVVSVDKNPIVEFQETRGKAKKKAMVELDLSEFMDTKGWKSMGNKLSSHPVAKLKYLSEKSEEASAKVDNSGVEIKIKIQKDLKGDQGALFD